MSKMADLHMEITQLLKAKWSWGEIADQIVSQYKVPRDWAVQQVRAIEEATITS
jgi:hypothetical protein